MSEVINIMSCKSTLNMDLVTRKVNAQQCLLKIKALNKVASLQYLFKTMSLLSQIMEVNMGHATLATILKAMKCVTDELGCPGVGRIQPCCLGDFQPCPQPLSLWDSQCYCPGGTTWLGCPEQEHSAWLPRRGAFSLAAHIQAKLTEFRNTNIFCWWSVTAESDGYLRRHCVPSPSSRIFLIAM